MQCADEDNSSGVTKGGKGGHNFPGAESLWKRQITAGASKGPDNVTSTFFNTAYLPRKDLRFEHGGAKLASCPGRHLTSLYPWIPGVIATFVICRLSFSLAVIFIVILSGSQNLLSYYILYLNVSEQGKKKIIHNLFGEIKHLKQSLNFDKSSYAKMCLIIFRVCKVYLEME